MLIGDKMEIVINIGRSCWLLIDKMESEEGGLLGGKGKGGGGGEGGLILLFYVEGCYEWDEVENCWNIFVLL